MTLLISYAATAFNVVRRRWRASRADGQRGSTPEETALIALMVVMAITVVGIVTAKVVTAATGISLP